MAYGGAQSLYRIDPDLTAMGKIIGGGLPVAAYGGRRDIMERVAPLGPVYQAGTLSGNPLAMRAGLATLPKLAAAGFYEELNRKAAFSPVDCSARLTESGVIGQVNAVGSLMTMFFSSSRCGIMPARRNPTRKGSRSFSGRCWIVEFFWRLRSLRRCLFRRRIAMRISSARLRQRGEVWKRSAVDEAPGLSPVCDSQKSPCHPPRWRCLLKPCNF